jgi:ribosomal protein S18 acetylase RimI-like enzyme
VKIEFREITDFPRGTLAHMLADAYGFDPRWAAEYSEEWRSFDDFFFDDPAVAVKYGFVTTVDDEPVGFISWNPRHRPEYEEIGYNCILARYKRRGHGTRQLREAVRRILLDRPQKIIVTTNASLIPAQKMYERVGFRKTGERPSPAFPGALLDYEFLPPPAGNVP